MKQHPIAIAPDFVSVIDAEKFKSGLPASNDPISESVREEIERDWEERRREDSLRARMERRERDNEEPPHVRTL